MVKNSDLIMDYNRIKKVALPVDDTDAASKKYVDSVAANTISESIKDSSNFDEFKEALLARISMEGIDKDE